MQIFLRLLSLKLKIALSDSNYPIVSMFLMFITAAKSKLKRERAYYLIDYQIKIHSELHFNLTLSELEI